MSPQGKFRAFTVWRVHGKFALTEPLLKILIFCYILQNFSSLASIFSSFATERMFKKSQSAPLLQFSAL